MWSYFTSIINYFFENPDENEKKKEQFILDELIDLQLQADRDEYHDLYNQNEDTIPKNSVCFQRSGVISHCTENYVLIDGTTYFDTSHCPLQLNINDKISYLGYIDSNDKLVIVRILENQGLCWDDEDLSEEHRFDIMHHTLVGKVDCRENRIVHMQGGDLKFNLDDVQGVFVPIQGDWLEIQCTVQKNEDNLTDVNMKQVLNVISFSPVRSKIVRAVVTEWFGSEGTLDRKIYFNHSTYTDTILPQVGIRVMVEAIESDQGKYSWRAIKLVIVDNKIIVTNPCKINDEEQQSLYIEKDKNIILTHPLKFDNVNITSTDKINLSLTNNSTQMYVLNKWIILSKKRDSQIVINPYINQPRELHPSETIKFAITCQPKFLGSTRECLLILFKGFQLKRFIEINIIDNLLSTTIARNGSVELSKYSDLRHKMIMIHKDNDTFIPGERNFKIPHFISNKIGHYPVPDKIWSAVLGDSEQTVYTDDYNRILTRIQTELPCLITELNINNYCNKWHTLLFMDEIQANINIRAFDMSKTYLIRHQEYLALEINGLCERRPSLIVGDRVIVKDTWSSLNKKYEGFIHMIKGEMVLLKFHSRFHEIYDGGDVAVEFFISRSSYKRAHHAITTVQSSLGPHVLFPSRIILKATQVSDDKINHLKWYNNKLNSDQKQAIINILKGESRPLPYIIFGPPGTGKTITVIETILQILKNIPDSRILVAAPSNSASNLITERLLQYRHNFSSSVVRLIANYLVDSENIPDIIKPYCATLDISVEGTSNTKQFMRDSINLNSPKSFIGRHKITIATCNCIGSLFALGFRKGHFTHVIIDEAGQANEPEAMIPMSFIDRDNGQIILAGDPMQLGPVITSKYCSDFGMGESYLCRLLECYPYQKDYDSFTDGFDDRVVTKLNSNYRSLEEVLSLPSKMFYDNTLVSNIDKCTSWIPKMIDATCDIFNITENKSGGIFVYGIKGQNTRATDSPSWFNPQEASMLALTTCKLYKKDVTPEEIGIISPYIAQIKYLRHIFDAIGLPQPKMGTVEEFQGQERPIILISTVRSSESLIHEDIKHVLGFLQNPKRVNVAITRAQVSLILFCNPHLLWKDAIWNQVLTDAVKNQKYRGCYLPSELEVEK